MESNSILCGKVGKWLKANNLADVKNDSILTMSMQPSPLDVGPLIVKPREARRMLACGNTRLYELLAAGELESFLDGRSRKITVESIRR